VEDRGGRLAGAVLAAATAVCYLLSVALSELTDRRHGHGDASAASHGSTTRLRRAAIQPAATAPGRLDGQLHGAAVNDICQVLIHRRDGPACAALRGRLRERLRQLNQAAEAALKDIGGRNGHRGERAAAPT